MVDAANSKSHRQVSRTKGTRSLLIHDRQRVMDVSKVIGIVVSITMVPAESADRPKNRRRVIVLHLAHQSQLAQVDRANDEA